MTRGPWFLLLSLAIALAITHGSLWARGIRPSKRAGLWDRFSWEIFPKDEQTKEYLRKRFQTAILVLPTTVAVLYLLSEM